MRFWREEKIVSKRVCVMEDVENLQLSHGPVAGARSAVLLGCLRYFQ